MLATGTDAVAGNQDAGKLRYADDVVSMPLQCGTQWDGLGHIFYGDRMWNGYDARLVDSNGAHKNGIQKTRNRMAGRGVLLDVARHCGAEFIEDGMAITCADLDATARLKASKSGGRFRHRAHRTDGTASRGGRMGRLRRRRRPRPRFRNRGMDSPQGNRCDLHGYLGLRGAARMRPTTRRQPWHWVVIPMIGITMGEIFYLKDLADDCAQDRVYEFFFCAPPLPITGAVGRRSTRRRSSEARRAR